MDDNTATVVRDHLPDQAVFRSVLPEEVDWKPFPAFPASVRLAVVVGRPSDPGPYVIRVKVPSGIKLMPHRHPEDRVYTVMSGVFYIGLGDRFDADKLRPYPPGSIIVLPGNTSHFHWAKSGEYITQVSAIGPLGLEYVNPRDDPREPVSPRAQRGGESRRHGEAEKETEGSKWMTATSPTPAVRHDPVLQGQTVVVIGGSAGIGLETARRAREEGAQLILTARDPDRLNRAGHELGASSIAAFDATDFKQLATFFEELPAPINHLLLTGPGPYYAPLKEFDFDKARRDIESHLLLPIQIARQAAGKVSPGGTLLFMGGTGGRHPAPGFALISALTAALPALIKTLALELAPSIRVNLIAAGFVDTPLSATLLGEQLDARREQLRTMLPIRRVVDPADIAALAVHLMTNSAVTGATLDIDGGQQLVSW